MKRCFVVKVLCLILTFICVKSKEDLPWYALIVTLSTSLNYIFNIVHIKKYINFQYKNLYIKKHLKPVMILFAASLATEVYTLADTTMLSVVFGDTEVGYYYTSMRIIAILRTLTVSMIAVLYPRISYYYLNGLKDQFYSMVNKGINLLLLCTVPAFIGIALLADSIIIFMFGQDFAASIVCTRILSISIVTVAFSNFIGSQLFVAMGREKMMFISTVIGAVVNIILNMLLIFKFKHNGVAFASAVTELCVTAFQWYVLTKKIKIKPQLYDLKSIIIASLCMVGTVLGIKFLYSGNYVIQLFFCVGAGALVFTVTACMLKNSILCAVLTMIKDKIK